MADVAGLILGTIALASLFSTCIDCFDYFELGRNYAYDYQLACTKVVLLKARLSTWGLTLTINKPGHEHPALRQHWAEEKEIIARSLFGIKDIFENASLLVEKYRLTPSRSTSFKSAVLHRSMGQQDGVDGVEEISSAKASTSSWKFLRKRTVWAIHDKQKFDRFIQDLGFLIENLEKVTQRLATPMPVPRPEKETSLTVMTQPQISDHKQKFLDVSYHKSRDEEQQAQMPCPLPICPPPAQQPYHPPLPPPSPPPQEQTQHHTTTSPSPSPPALPPAPPPVLAPPSRPRAFKHPYPQPRDHHPVRSPSKSSYHSLQPSHPLIEISRHVTGSIYTGSQHTASGTVVMGTIGSFGSDTSRPRNLYTGNQTATRGGFAVMGDVSVEAMGYLGQRDH